MRKLKMRADEYQREACRQLSGLEDWMSNEGDTETSQIVNAIYAQTLATLALSEQQRIANLIAMIGLGAGSEYSLDLEQEFQRLQNAACSKLIDYEYDEDDGDTKDFVNIDIARALGVVDVEP